MEFPYGASLGMPERFETKPVSWTTCVTSFPPPGTDDQEDMSISSVAGDPTTVFVEYEADCPTPEETPTVRST